MHLKCRCESTFQDSIFVRYPCDPVQADESMFIAWTCVLPPQPEHVTQSHLPLFSSNVGTFLHLLSFFSPFFFSGSCSVGPRCPLALTYTLSPPVALCLQISRSVFSPVCWVIPALVTLSFSPLLTPNSSPPHPRNIWPASQPELAVALINTSVRWFNRNRGRGSVTVCVCVCLFVSGR